MPVRRYVSSTWKQLAFASSAVVFLVAMAAMAARGWHAPGVEVLIPLFAFGVFSGAAVNVLRARSRALAPHDPDDEAAIVDVTSARPTTFALAGIIAVGTSMLSGVALGLAMGRWNELFLASMIGALYMASWPLQVIAAHAVIERRLSVGLDGVRLGKRHFPFRTLASASVDVENTALLLRVREGRVVPFRCASLEMARDLADRIVARLEANAEPATHIGREGRSLEVWKRELLAQGYRGSEISPENAARILGSSNASADERIGAALVLAGRTDGEARDRERTRIRVAAAACVDPRLRVALERVAEDTLDETTLETLEPRRAMRGTSSPR